jgi:predicted amidohydrolase YtcJ
MSRSDLVILGGRLEGVAGPYAATRAEAIAVANGRIVVIGPSAEIVALAGPGTRVVRLHGHSVLPGFIDAHIHPISGGLVRNQCDLHDLVGADAYLQAVAAYATAHGDRPWIVGGGWSLADFPGGTPGRDLLDRLVPDRPVVLHNRDGHGAWVNSAALALAGVDRHTPDPADGRIERDADGEPAGMLHEGAMHLVERRMPAPTHAERIAALLESQRYLHSLGITAWQDAMVEPEELAAYQAAADDGSLSARVTAAQLWDNHLGPEQIDGFVERRDSITPGRLRAGSVKLFLDGIIENNTAFMVQPYLDRQGGPTDNRGIPMIDPNLLKQAVVELDRLGLQCHFHAIGDAAVRQGLDAIEAARAANGAGHNRHHIAHLELIHPDDIPRFAALGAVANIQPFWAMREAQMRDLRIPFLGLDRARWQFPFRSLLDSGARLAAGSDWPVTTPNPLLEMEVAMTRTDPAHRDGESLFPEERLDLDAALAAFTIGSAHVNHAEGRTGSLEVGKEADLVVLDRDIRRADGGPIGDARVLATFVGGVPVWDEL